MVVDFSSHELVILRGILIKFGGLFPKTAEKIKYVGCGREIGVNYNDKAVTKSWKEFQKREIARGWCDYFAGCVFICIDEQSFRSIFYRERIIYDAVWILVHELGHFLNDFLIIRGLDDDILHNPEEFAENFCYWFLIPRKFWETVQFELDLLLRQETARQTST